MIIDGIRGDEDEEEASSELSGRMLFLQGVATSIDALSTGFTTADYHVFEAFVSSMIIAVVTFFICVAGVKLGKRFGLHLAGRAQILGGVILVLIGVKICFFG